MLGFDHRINLCLTFGFALGSEIAGRSLRCDRKGRSIPKIDADIPAIRTAAFQGACWLCHEARPSGRTLRVEMR